MNTLPTTVPASGPAYATAWACAHRGASVIALAVWLIVGLQDVRSLEKNG